MEAKDIRQICFLDSETTGINPDDNDTIEIAVALYDIEFAAVIMSFASLIHATINNDAEHVNRIPNDLLLKAPSHTLVWPTVCSIIERADVIVAHRIEFDKQFVPASIRNLKPWACSKMDMQFPKSRPERGEHLVHFALAHDVPVYSAHRAMTDVDTLVRLFQAVEKMGHDIPRMISLSMRPKARFNALVSYADKDLAKEAGFQWDPEKKTWSRECFLDEAVDFKFKTKQV